MPDSTPDARVALHAEQRQLYQTLLEKMHTVTGMLANVERLHAIWRAHPGGDEREVFDTLTTSVLRHVNTFAAEDGARHTGSDSETVRLLRDAFVTLLLAAKLQIATQRRDLDEPA